MPVKYDYGDLVVLAARFMNLDGVLTDPTTVTVKTLSPLNTTTSYVYGSSAIVKDAVGVYRLNVRPTTEGMWSWRIEGTGAVEEAFEGKFYVEESAFY